MVDLFSKRRYFFVLSIILVLSGIIGLMVKGVKLDIQFQGGTLMQIFMSDDSYNTEDIQAAISKAIGKSVTAQKMQTYNAEDSSSKINLLQLRVAKDSTLTGEEINQVVELLKKDFNVSEDAQMQIQSVEPFMGKEMLQKGILAAIIASVLIVLYVWWRFSVMSGLSAAIFANLALIHDAFIMFSVYVVFGLPLNESFLAAVLTILGFSINDTIVVYDRIRENTKAMRNMPYSQLVNTSVIQTISRTINTTVTVMICVITLYVFAFVNNIDSIKDFSFPLMIGLLSGTYSTIFIASPLWAVWQEARLKRRVAAKAAKSN
ncbi:protein translocase subunit secF [Anaerobacterium chartisolvens]|uniref:Protein-export membrane protein SecF n=1 Tax=Anaerobacterium chartisolvens TaxID=1297424 RepID=A0A369AXD6_9FIRM|nr:protein translocase subunit SecF [Anaerobacterium chartisolvens]RCX13823.1 protein translocase subunit secF [Anaerobacterium chartisolvens]